MRIIFLGNQDNLGYELCSWSREMGIEGEVISFDHDLPRSQPELVDGTVSPGRYPDWFSIHRSPLVHFPVVSSALCRRLESSFDLAVVSGTRGLLASRTIRLPKIMYAIGGDVAEAPFPFGARWRGPVKAVFRVLRFPFARAAIRKMDRIIENYEVNLHQLRRLKLIDRRASIGIPENAAGCRALVDPALRATLTARYGRYRRLFIWLTRVNFAKPDDPAYKGAERFAAALKAVKSEILGGQIRLVLATHGDDVEAFRRLIVDAGLSDHCDWVPHLPFPHVVTYLSLPNAVVFGKFGERLGMPAAIDRDCMIMGSALVSTVDLEFARAIYGERPPVLSATTVPEIAARMREVFTMDDAALRDLQARMAAFGQDYIDYHAVIPRFLDLAREVVAHSRSRDPA